MDNRKHDCVFCVCYGKCDLEQQKDHGYNLRDGTDDCFVPHGKIVPPWLDPFTECYGCMNHSYENCSECFVYFGGRFAYQAVYCEKFKEDLLNQNMASVDRAGKHT